MEKKDVVSEMNISDNKYWTRKRIIGWIVSIVLAAIIMFLPTTATFTLQLKEFFAILLFSMSMFAFELFENNMVPSLIMCMLFLVFKLGTADQIFSGFANNIPWAMVGSLMIVGVMGETKILQRMAYGLVMKTSTKVLMLMLIINAIGLVMSTVLAVNIGFPLAVVTFGLCKALDIEANSNTAAKLMMNSYFSMTCGGTAFLSVVSLMGAQVISSVVEGFSITYIDYFKHNWPYLIYAFILMFLLHIFFKDDQKVPSKEVLREEHSKLGKLSATEWKLIVVFIVLFVCMLLNGVLDLQIGWMILIAGIVCFLPFLKMGTAKALKEIRWPLVVFMVACLGIGSVASNVGAGDFVANLCMPAFASAGKLGTLMLIYLVGVVVNFVLTPLAALSTLLIPFANIGTAVGLSPNIILYVFQNSLNQALLPYEIAFAMFVFGFGYMKMKHFAKAGLIMLVSNFIWTFAVMVPYWSLMGLY